MLVDSHCHLDFPDFAPDLDTTAASFGDHIGEVRAAVQPGRRIATLKRSAGLGLPVALMTPFSSSE